MLKIKKILLFIMILVSLNLTKLSIEANASERLGINLFANPGFEKTGKFNFAPFIVKYNKDSLANVFAKGEIVDGIGIGGSRALDAELMPRCSGRIYGNFTVTPGSTYRLSAAGRRTEEDDNPMHIGVRNYDETITNSEAISGQFDTLEYQYKHVDFVVGKETTEVEIFIYYPKPKPFYQTGGYIDDLVIEEIAYPPTINPIYDPTIAENISGTAEPGMEVKITLPNKTENKLKVEEDGTFNLPISLGSLKDGDVITAVQYGLYNVESAVTESVVAEKRLGKNLFQNPGFELPDDFNFAPFIIKYNSDSLLNVFQIGEIRNGIGSINPKEPNKNRGLYLRLMPHCEGVVPGVFSVNSLSNYRVSAEGRRWEDDDGKDGHVGVRGFNNANQDLRSGSFDTLQYKYRYVDFLVGNNIREVEAYIYVPKSDFWYQADLYIDNFVIEETAFPPDINPINNASATTAITGESDPGTKVEASLLSGGNTIFYGETGYDGIYSIPVPRGTIKNGDIVVVKQHGLYNIISQPSYTIASDSVPPPAPSINVVRDKDTLLTGKSEPYSIVTIEFQNGDVEETNADIMGNYSLDLTSKILIAGQSIQAKARDVTGNISETTTTKIMDTANTIIDEAKGIAIYAKNFILNLGETPDLTDEEVFRKSEARAFKINDEDNSSLDIEVNASVFKDEVGVYPVFLEVEERNKTIYVSVIDPENSIVSEQDDLVIYAKDFSIKKDNMPSLNIAKRSELKAWRLSDGTELTSLVNIDDSALKAEKGKHNVKFNIGDVIHSIEVEVSDLDEIPPEIYNYKIISPTEDDGSNWTNEDIIIKLFARDNVEVDHDTYEVSTNLEGTNWSKDGLSNPTANDVIFTISSEVQTPNILVRVKDTAGNYSNKYDVKSKLSIKIDKTLPYCNYEDEKIYDQAPGKITFGDDLSGVSSAKLDGKEITSDSTIPEGRGEHILVIIDNAGNMLKVNFIIGSINTEVKVDGVIYSDGAKVSKIKRRGELTPETSVIIKNLDTKNEYIGFLKYGETLVFKEIEYGEYEIFCINPGDIAFVKSNAVKNKFLINQQNPYRKVTINNKFVKLNGFGEIIEENNKKE